MAQITNLGMLSGHKTLKYNFVQIFCMSVWNQGRRQKTKDRKKDRKKGLRLPFGTTMQASSTVELIFECN